MMFLYGLIAGILINQAYARGWLKLAYDWAKAKATERKPTALPLLDQANAAPEASSDDKQKFSMSMLYIAVALFGALAVAFAVVVALKQPKVEPVITPPAVQVSPVAEKQLSPVVKKAVKPVASPTVKQTLTVEKPSEPIKTITPPEPLSDFDKRVLTFEGKMP
jgi:hypothetical protein